MTLRTTRIPTFLLIAAMVLPTLGCAYSGGPVKGRVLDEQTNTPIGDAIVVVLWQGTAFSFVESPTVCIHVETATTDKDGRYRIPFWHASTEPSGVRGIQPYVAAIYKIGYQRSTRMPDSLGDGDQYLKQFKGTRVERLEQLARVISSTGCANEGKSEINKFVLFKSIYEEAKQFAITQKDQEAVQWMREMAARAWVSQSLTSDNSEEGDRLVKEYLKEHLK